MLQKKQNIFENKSSPLTTLSIWAIRVIYQNFLKDWKAKKDLKKRKVTICSFYPSCSNYGILALRKYGFFKGWLLTIYRIKRCNAFIHKQSCVDYP